MQKELLGVCPLCNTASVNVYEVNEDYVLAGINDAEPEECELLWDRLNEETDEEEAVIPYFKLGELEIGLNEVMRLDAFGGRK